MDILNQISDSSLPLLHHWGYWFILMAAFAEAMPFGFLVPGQIIVIASGFFAKLGIFDLGDVIWVGTLGAVLGDLISYLVGRTYGYSFLKRFGRYVLFKESYLEQTKILMNEHAGKTIIIGRFNMVTRSFAPFIAGASAVPIYRFLYYNIIGGAIWVAASVMIGYIFGESFEVAGRLIGQYIAIAVALSIGLVIALRYINKKWQVFTQYHLPILTVNVAALYFLAEVISNVMKGKDLIKLDIWIDVFWRHLETPLATKIMAAISDIFSPYSLAAFSVLALYFLVKKKKWFQSLVLFISLGGGFVFTHIAKQAVARTRPPFALVPETDFSFPSMHATIAVIFFGFLIYALRDRIKGRLWRALFAAGCVSSCLAVGLSRIYLHVHWFSDVLAGFSLGLFWLTLVIIIMTFLFAIYKPGTSIMSKLLNKAINKIKKKS